MVDLAVIIVNFNTTDLTLDCVKKVVDQKTNLKLEVVVVDNGSTDDSILLVKKQFPQVKLIRSDQNLGFPKGNNLGIKKVHASYYFLLNSDAFIKSGSLDRFVEFAKVQNLGIVGCRVENKDGSFQPNGGKSPNLLNIFSWLSGLDDILGTSSYQAKNIKYFQNNQIGWVSGTAMLISDETIRKIGLLDSKIFMYGEDVEYCLRAQKRGINVGWSDEIVVTHLGGASSKDPKLNQWRGEFRGLLYIYHKYYGGLDRILVRLMMYIFIVLRIVVFTLTGKFNYAKTYGKIVLSI